MIVCLSPNGLNRYTGSASPTRLIVGTSNGVRLLERGDATEPWQSVGGALERLHVSSLLYEPKHGGLFAGIHAGGLYFSDDGGRTWQRRTNGLTEEHVFSLRSVDAPSGTIIYAGTEPAALFKTHDYGQTWQELPAVRDVSGREKWTFPAPPHVAHAKTIAFDPRDAQTFYLGIEQGALLKTTDGGASWRELAGYARAEDRIYRDIHQVVPRPGHPDEIFMSGGIGLYYSPDAGETWEHLTDRDFRIGYPDQLLFSPLDDRVLFMSGAKGSPGTWRGTESAAGTIVRSGDLGRTWEVIDRGLPDGMRANVEAMSMQAYAGGFVLFVGTTDGDVYVSDDGANRWSLVASGLGAISKGDHFRNLEAVAP
ncbi:MAG TPA: YCF48-related protein [Chloroflexota bacterium]|nr:YCF48-related protein [Chloroflexota bacterium]